MWNVQWNVPYIVNENVIRHTCDARVNARPEANLVAKAVLWKSGSHFCLKHARRQSKIQENVGMSIVYKTPLIWRYIWPLFEKILLFIFGENTVSTRHSRHSFKARAGSRGYQWLAQFFSSVLSSSLYQAIECYCETDIYFFQMWLDLG